MSTSRASDLCTRGIRVKAIASFIPERSDPAAKTFIFAYRICIENEGTESARLLSRHWIIIDADGEREEIQGEGVVGETPLLDPGESFTYTSYCPLTTHWGTMEGAYIMEDLHGEQFPVEIGRFFLVADAIPSPELAS